MRDTETGSIALFDAEQEEIVFICHLTEMHIFKANASEQGIAIDALKSVPIRSAFDASIKDFQVVHDAEAEATDAYAYEGTCCACEGNIYRNVNGLDAQDQDIHLQQHIYYGVSVAQDCIAGFCRHCIKDSDKLTMGCARALKQRDQTMGASK